MTKPTRYYFLIPKNLKMGRGKIAAQVAHAAFKVAHKHENLENYNESDFSQLVLYTKDHEELEQIQQKCKEQQIPFEPIRDGGRTQVQPDTHTVTVIGPLNRKAAQELMGELKLVN